MKKMCSRVLAILLTVVMMLSVLPLSVFASWLDVEAENTQSGNVASSDIKVTVTAKEFLQYLKDGDIKGLLKGISLSGLRGIVSADELFEIVPSDTFAELVDIIVSDVKSADLMQYIDMKALLETVDTDALIALVKDLPNLQDYVKDYNALMGYVDENKLADALDYIDVDALVDDYASDLIDLALDLPADTLSTIVDVSAVIELDEIDFSEVLNADFFENLDDPMQYIDDTALHDFIQRLWDENRLTYNAIRHFTDENALVAILKRDEYFSRLSDYMDTDALRSLIEAEGIGYADLRDRGIVDNDRLIALIDDAGYGAFEAYLNIAGAQTYVENKYAGREGELAGYYDATGETLDVAGVFADGIVTVDELIDNGLLDVSAMLFNATSPCYINTLVDTDVLDALAIISGNASLLTIPQLEENGVIDYKVLMFGDDDKSALFDDISVLFNEDVFNFKGMLREWTDDEGVHSPLFTYKELVSAGVILENALLADGYTYSQMVDMAALKQQLNMLLDNGTLTVDQIKSCLKKTTSGALDYKAMIDAIGGVETIVADTTLTYTAILTDYVTDLVGLLNELGVDQILRAIVTDGKLDAIFDVNGLINAIGVSDLIKLVDIKTVAQELINKEAIIGLVRALSPNAYVAWTSDLLNVLSRNVQSIEINGVVVTEKPYSDILTFNTKQLLACVQAAIPTLNDLANLDADGTLVSLSVAVTYASDATNGVAKTKKIGVSLCLNGGADQIRRVAAKIESLLAKFVSYSYNNGNLTLDFKIPAEFATVIKYALTHLANDADPELVKLKDELLGLYDANLSDLGNFVGNVTIGQIVTIFEKIDSSHFERAYNAVLRQRYVAVIVDYIAEATGVDLSSVSLDALMRKLDDIPALPTLEQIAQKIEELVGRDIVSKLPTRVQNVWTTVEGERVTDLISRLAARVGVDFDLQEILENAATSDDPIQYLYDAVVDKIEIYGYVYTAASNKLMRVFNTVMASSYGQKIDKIRLCDYYRGNGKFGFDVSYTFSPETVLKKSINKVMNFVLSKRDFNTDYIDKALTIFYALLSDTKVDVGLDASVTVNGLYKASLYDEDGRWIRSVFIPKGTNLNLMVGYTPADDGATFLGWKDATAADTVYYTVMPAKDIKLIADVDTKQEPILAYYDVSVNAYDENGQWLFALNQKVRVGTYVKDAIENFDLTGNANYPVLEGWEQILYTFKHEWRKNGQYIGATETVEGDLELSVVISRDYTNASAQLNAERQNYKLSYADSLYRVTWNETVWGDTMDLRLKKSFVAYVVENNCKLTMDTIDAENGNSITLDTALLTNLLAVMNEREVDEVRLIYRRLENNNISGANRFSFAFTFDGVAIGNFFGDGTVAIRMPFTGQNSVDVKTFLYIDNDETALTEINERSVVFNAPHFSDFVLVNKYHLSYTAHKWEGVDESLLGDLANVADIATKPIGEGYYEAGCILNVLPASVYPTANGVELLRTEVVGTQIAWADDEETTYTMPASAVTLQQIVTAKTYYIYYYVGARLDGTVQYTKFSAPTWETITAYAPTASVAAGGAWFGTDTSVDLATDPQDLYLFLTWEGDEKAFTMNFTIEGVNGEVTFSITHTVAEWLGRDLALLGSEINAKLTELGVRAADDTRAISWLNGEDNLNAYTIEEWKTLMSASNSVSFTGRYEERKYTIFTDGNAELTIDSANAGTRIEFTVINKVGMNASVSIIVNGIETVLTDNFFEMPDSDVMVKVSYTKKTYTYGSLNATYGDKVEFSVSIPAGYTLRSDIDVTQLTSAPVGLELIDMYSNGDQIVLKYAFTANDENEGVDLDAFQRDVNSYIVALEYKNVYIVDGKSYSSIKAAEASLPDGVVVKEWKQVDKNLFVAELAYEGEESHAGLIVLIVVLVIIILILLIALFYTLYICGKLAPNWFLKAITVIVSVFFKVCMAIAAAGLAIARLFGYEEKELVAPEEPTDEAVLDNAVEETVEDPAEKKTDENETNE